MTRKHVIVGTAICVGLLHFVTGPDYGGPCERFVNGYLIDILLPFAMYLLLSLIDRPFALPRAARAAAVLGVGATVETLQYLGVPVFGRTFDPVDFLMYGLGITGGLAFERTVLSRLSPDAPESPGAGDTTRMPTWDELCERGGASESSRSGRCRGGNAHEDRRDRRESSQGEHARSGRGARRAYHGAGHRQTTRGEGVGPC